tara:strand:+ start:216 stop:554 length:339 start_codon:yes stop_codon:yes gene_type:complete
MNKMNENNDESAHGGIDSKFLISLLTGLIIQAGGIVWWASKLQSDVQHNDFQIQMIGKDVEKHAIFVRDWPAGKWGSGSLPDDVKQNLKIGMLENDMDKVMSKLYNGHPKEE